MTGQSYRILLVEDEPIIAAGIATKLRQLGYEMVGQSASGENAIRLVDSLEPDLILMDISLEGRLDGIDAAGRIRARHDIPVVFMTAYADEATVARATRHDPFAYVVKPITDRELYGAIEVSMHRYVLHREIRRSEERYRMLTEVLSDYAFGIRVADDPPSERVEWSVGSPDAVFGPSVGAIESLDDLLKICHPDDIASLRSYIAKLRAGGSGRLEFRTLVGSDAQHWVKIDGQGSRKRVGRETLLYAACQDVTSLRQTEAELEERELELSRMVQTMRQGIWVGDSDGVCIFVNDTLTTLTGLNRDDLVGRKSLPRLIGVEPGRATGGPDGDAPFEAELVTTSGTMRPVLVTPRTVTEGSSVRGSFYLLVDMTQQQERYEGTARRRDTFRAVFRKLPVPAAMVDPATNTVVEANESFAELVGVSATDLAGSGVFALVDFRNLGQLNLMVDLLANRRESVDVDLRAADGTYRSCAMRIELIASDEHLAMLTVSVATHPS